MGDLYRECRECGMPLTIPTERPCRCDSCCVADRYEKQLEAKDADLSALNRALADERAAVAIAHERIAEVTAERDARPEISRVAARRYIEWRDGFSPHPANVDRLEQVDDALRAHAAGSGKGGDDA